MKLSVTVTGQQLVSGGEYVVASEKLTVNKKHLGLRKTTSENNDNKADKRRQID